MPFKDSAGASAGMIPRDPVIPEVIHIEEVIPSHFTPLVQEIRDVIIQPYKDGTRIEAVGVNRQYLKKLLAQMNFTIKKKKR